MSRPIPKPLILCLLTGLTACDSQAPNEDQAVSPQPLEAYEAEPPDDGELETISAEGLGTPNSVSVTHTIELTMPSETESSRVDADGAAAPGPFGEVREEQAALAPEAEDPSPARQAGAPSVERGADSATGSTGAHVRSSRSSRDAYAAIGSREVQASGGRLGIVGGGFGGAGRGAGRGQLALGGNLASGPVGRDRVRGYERFEDYGENDWTVATDDPLATFSIDVDTASYAIARRDLNRAHLPNPAGIRVEEFINVFDYGYASPHDTDTPFAVHLEAAPSHFGDGLQLLRVGIQGFETDIGDRAPANLVFLIDTSGSMSGADKMGLVQYALGTLLSSLGPDDTLSIVTYSGRAETLLPPTHVDDRGAIMEAIDALNARGSTNGADGIRTAYEVAQSAFLEGGTNRVIWCTDGDLNVGMTGDELLEFVEDHGRRGVALTTLGFGRGNLNDRDLERFADHGDGNYHYIDDRNEALRVLGDELMATLEVIARDVKIQVEVNPRIVDSYRIIGYENRDVADADFRDDSVDAGEIGSGHNVTALLELDLNDSAVITRTERLATVRVRYEMPDEEGEGREIEQLIHTDQLAGRFEDASASLRLAAAVAEFAEVLRRGENATGAEFDEVERVVRGAHARGDLQVEELAALVTQARALWQD